MTDFDPSSFSNVEPQEFAQLVKNAPPEQIMAVMQGESRGKVLDEIFARFPRLFRADRAGSTNAVLHWNIGDRPDGGVDTYEVVIENGTCTVSEQPTRDPRLAITLGAVDFIKVVSGNANPVMMFMTGKLKAKGDLGLAANIQNLFDLPKA